MRTTGVWIVVALLLGLGTGYWLGAGQESAPAPAADIGSPAAAAAGDTEEPAPAPNAATPLKVAAEPAPPTLVFPRGSGIIRGRVTLETEDGVAGVLVTATPTELSTWAPPPPGRAPPHERDLDADLAQAARVVRLTHAGRRRALTDASGRYTLEGLAPGRYRILAWRENYEIRAARSSPAWKAEPGAVVDFRANPIVVAFLRVIGVDGKPARSASIRTSADEEGRKGRQRFSWTPERNWIELPPGERWIAAARGEDDEEKSARRHVTLLAGAEPPELTLELVGQPGIRGRVVLPESMEVPQLGIHAISFDGTQPPDAELAMKARSTERGRYDRREGTYGVRDIAAGQYLLIVTFDGYRAEHTEIVQVGNRTLEKDLVLPPMDPKRYRVVRVLDEAGKPVAGAQFSYDIHSTSLGMSTGVGSVERQDGSYYVSRSPTHALPAHARDDPALRFVLRLTVPGRSELELPCDPKAPEELVIRLRALASVHLTIDDFAESGLSGKCVIYVKEVLGETGMGFHGQGVPVTPEGRVFLEGLQAGETSVVLVSGTEHGPVQVAVFWLRLEGGENTPTVRLGRLHEVRFEGAESGVEVARLERGGRWTHQYAGAAGEQGLVAHFLPAGRYEASSAVAGKQKTVTFDVPAQTVVRFDR